MRKSNEKYYATQNAIELTQFEVAESEYQDFIYSVTLKTSDTSSKSLNILFGANEDFSSYWSLKIDLANNLMILGNEQQEIKSVTQQFSNNVEYKINLVVNAGVAKVYINNSDVASLVLSLDGYSEGFFATDANTSGLTCSKVSLTSFNTIKGDIFTNGYDVLRVVNLTDGNYCLKESEYEVKNSVVTIKDEYLQTLEIDTEYHFRAVTSLTDLDFVITTDNEGVEVRSTIAKYYRGNDVKLELSQGVEVSSLFIDGEEYHFTQDKERVIISNADLATLNSGSHNLKLYTSNGRPETTFQLSEVVETIPDLPEKVSHTFFFIDIIVFAVLIIGYILFSKLKKK